MRQTVQWHGKQRSIRRLARLYRGGLSTHAIAKIETKRIGKAVRPYQVYNALRSVGLRFRTLSAAMFRAPSLQTAHVRL